MCTAVTYLNGDFYFGRNLDYDFCYGESVAVAPRKYPFRSGDDHFAVIGMAHIRNDYPLYYDAMNENGLCIAGLNFVGNAVYAKPSPERENVAQYEFVPWLLGQCATAAEARRKISGMNMTGEPFSEEMPPSPLHWLIADRNDCFTLEIVRDGVHIYDNPTGVLTNNPPFPMQMAALNNYMQLSPRNTGNRFSEKIPLSEYSRGMGAIGLPGDLSSQSRFVRAAFVRANSVSGKSEDENVSQFFHILTSVEQQRGCCEIDGGKFEITLYSSCCNADKGIYYYTTYGNRAITAVDLNSENLDSGELIRYPLRDRQSIFWENHR